MPALTTKKFKTIDQYISPFPPNVQILLETLRKAIKKAAPDAVEVISYNMPAFKCYETSKGTIKFPFDKPMPVRLVKKMIKYRVNENMNKAISK